MKTLLAVAWCVLFAAGGRLAAAEESSAAPRAAPPLYEGLGTHSRKITGTTPEAQRYFDQGVAFVHGFNHDEGLRAMQQAAALAPECAMAWWGVAFACGPHINNTAVSAERARLAVEALAKAENFSAGCTAAERALVAAQKPRFASPPPKEGRAALDRAHADAMREVYRAHPGDADIAAWFAAALMQLRPWDLWTREGQPHPGTEEAIAALEAAMRIEPHHPLALHLTIHAWEMSSTPARADIAADRLRDLQPLLGHMTHMPSHTDVRCGRWEAAILANTKAIAADRRYCELSGKAPAAYLSYMAHDYHMLTYGAMMSGQGALALRTMRSLLADMPPEWREKNTAQADGYIAMVYEVQMRFGSWDDILAEPEPEAKFTLARAWRHAARAVAHAAKGEPALAREDQAKFVTARAAVPPKMQFRKNDAGVILGVTEQLLEGEILLREGRGEPGLEALREAVRREDALRYAEPPAWIQPVRHALGASLMARGRFAEAEQVYRDDLARLPDNGWSLFGLARRLRLQKQNAGEATTLEARFKKIWAKADLELTSSCLCQPGV